MSPNLTWGPDDHREYDEAVQTALRTSKVVADPTRRFADLVADGVQAHRIWANDIERDALWRGLGSILRAEEKKVRSHTVKGRTISGTWGITRETIDGSEQLRLEIEEYTWDDLDRKTREFAKQVKAHNRNIAICAALADLQDRAPQARTVGEALAELNTDLQSYLDGYFGEQAA